MTHTTFTVQLQSLVSLDFTVSMGRIPLPHPFTDIMTNLLLFSDAHPQPVPAEEKAQRGESYFRPDKRTSYQSLWWIVPFSRSCNAQLDPKSKLICDEPSKLHFTFLDICALLKSFKGNAIVLWCEDERFSLLASTISLLQGQQQFDRASRA